VEVPYWCVDSYIRNADPIHESLCALTPDGALRFWNRKQFLAQNPPCHMPIIGRFLMQVRNEIRVLWRGEIKVQA